jgi:hypothetical protein
MSGDKSKLLTQNVLLLQRDMEKKVNTLKEKMKHDLDRKRKTEAKDSTAEREGKFSNAYTNVYHSTFIRPSAVLISSDSLPRIYFLHFRNNNFIYFASKLPKAALSREIRARLEYSNFQK